MNRPVLSGKRCFLSNAISFSVLVLFLSAFCFVSNAFGQASTATLSGTVVDEKGAVIPGASVTIVNVNTQASRQTSTNGEGYFVFPLLQPSNYKLSVEGQGFSPVQVPDVVLNVGDQKALQIQLRAGDVNAQVTIDSDAETVRTDGSVGTVVNRQFVANIPLNGRSLQALIQLTPGVVLTRAGEGSEFSVNGQRTTSNYFTVDGVSANTGMAAGDLSGPAQTGSGQAPGTTALGGTNSLVSLDALQEFRIETSTYAPEFGRTTGGQISLVTRSGTNQFHGSASYFFRNEALDANDWFANSRRQPKPHERQNLFGGVLGGPLFVPRFGEGGPALFNGRNRLFFFASYEGLRLQQPKATLTSVMTASLRAQAFPALRPYINAIPLQNGRDLGNGNAEFTASYSDPARYNIFSLRLDANLTNSVTGFFRINHAPSDTQTRTGSLSTVQSLKVRNDSVTAGVAFVGGSQFTADLRVNWTRNAPRRFYDLDSFGGAIVPQASDIFAPGRDPSRANLLFRGEFGRSFSFSWGAATSDEQRQFNLVSTASRLIGNHQLKVGVDYRRMFPLIGGGGSGLFEVVSVSSIFGDDIVNGQLLEYEIANGDPVSRVPIFSSLSAFIQDTWHPSTRLTLTYGGRFERVPPPTETTGRLPRVVLGIDNDVLKNLRLAPPGTKLWRGRFGEFAPRVGGAYQLITRAGRETTIRGGVGVMYDLDWGSIANAFGTSYPFVADKSLCCELSFPLSAAIRTPPVLGVDPPGRLTVVDPNLRQPYTIQWNTTVEQSLGSAQVVSGSYVGSTGRRLIESQFYPSQSLADFPNVRTSLNITRSIGLSSYKALQIQYRRRLQRGLQALGSYTLAQSRDTASFVNSITPATRVGGVLDNEFAPSDFDVRHVFSAAVTYDVPKLSAPTFARKVLRDWGLDLLVRYQSAIPVNPTASSVLASDGTFYISRPDLVPGQPLYVDDPTVPGGRRFNNAAFKRPAAGTQGNFPRNGLRGFPASQIDLALRRQFAFGENVRLQLRGELFNVFNHPNFGPVNTSITSPLFGQPTQMLNRSLGGLNALYQMGGPRSGQLAVKVVW